MDKSTAQALVLMNNMFYSRIADSFHGTRQKPWNGWYELVPLLKNLEPLSVIDLGCGNGRFFSFLQERHMHMINAYGYDSSEKLTSYARSLALPGCTFETVDLFTNLPNLPISLPHANVITAFGVWHHIPGKENRKKLLENLLTTVTRPGIVVITLWQSEEKKELPAPTALQADLEPGDRFIGWQHDDGAIRYSHRCTEEEISDLLHIQADTVGRFEADGKDGQSNTYLYYILK